jgi:hypothetical protein
MPGSAIQPSAACAQRTTLRAAYAIGERFVAWPAPSGRPDPRQCQLVTQAGQPAALNGQCTADMARVGAGGYRRITGQSSPRPPENCMWLLAWTIEALLRLEDRNTIQGDGHP